MYTFWHPCLSHLNDYKITMKFTKSQYKSLFFLWFSWLSFPIVLFSQKVYFLASLLVYILYRISQLPRSRRSVTVQPSAKLSQRIICASSETNRKTAGAILPAGNTAPSVFLIHFLTQQFSSHSIFPLRNYTAAFSSLLTISSTWFWVMTRGGTNRITLAPALMSTRCCSSNAFVTISPTGRSNSRP